VNRHVSMYTTRCTSPVSVVSQYNLAGVWLRATEMEISAVQWANVARQGLYIYASSIEKSVSLCFPSVRRSAVRPSVNTNMYFAWRVISVLSGGIWIKLATNIHHVSWHCWEGFHIQRSKVKVISKSPYIMTKAKEYTSTVWLRRSLIYLLHHRCTNVICIVARRWSDDISM